MEEKDIFGRFPKLFRQKDLPMTHTCMCWGLSCGKGWYPLIANLCEKINAHLKENPNIDQPEFAQVKEKFGMLRIYMDGGDDYIDELISQAESESSSVCEQCGAEGFLIKKGWWRTICSHCEANLFSKPIE